MDIIENITQAISILNKNDEYMEGLVDKLSNCDCLISDYQHFIENVDIEKVNSKELYRKMQENFQIRREIKKELAIKENYIKLQNRLNSVQNREFLLQKLKNAQKSLDTQYKDRILTEEEKIKLFSTKKKAGRPLKQEVI